MEKPIYRARLRNKGQITVPQEIRNVLGADEGDDLVFTTDENGRVLLSRAQWIDPEQAWFWSQRWQRMEVEAEEDLKSGRFAAFNNIQSALNSLNHLGDEVDAED